MREKDNTTDLDVEEGALRITPEPDSSVGKTPTFDSGGAEPADTSKNTAEPDLKQSSGSEPAQNYNSNSISNSNSNPNPTYSDGNDKERAANLISELIDKYSDMVYRTAYHTLFDVGYAEDITQELFLKLCSGLPNFDSEEHEKAWLLRVTINMCKNHNRKSFTHPSVELAETIPASDEYSAESSVMSAVRSLPEKYRTAIYLHYFEGYQTKEIAEMTDTNHNTVLSILKRGRKKLEEMLKGEFGENEII